MRNIGTFLKFGLVGVVNTSIDFAIFLFLYHFAGLNPLLANLISYASSVTNSYFLNRAWTFREVAQSRSRWNGYLLFVAVNSIGLLISTISIYLLSFSMAVEAAKIVSVLLTLVWNFLGTKIFVFRKED